jgi:two-component system, response regulator FlrC
MSAVLVVDDDVAMREFYHRALTIGGYQAIDVRTAEEAVTSLSLRPDIRVVVVGLSTQGHGGTWLVEQMRRRCPDVAVILETADEPGAGAVCLLSGVVSRLIRPISAGRLLDAVRYALDQRSQAAPRSASGDPLELFLDRQPTQRRGDGYKPAN